MRVSRAGIPRPSEVRVIGLRQVPEVKPSDNLAGLVLDAAGRRSFASSGGYPGGDA